MENTKGSISHISFSWLSSTYVAFTGQRYFWVYQKKLGPEGQMDYPDDYPFEHLLHFALSCKDIVVYFNSHHLLKARLQKALDKANLPALPAPSETCWGSLLECFESLLKAEEVLQAIVTHREFELGGRPQQQTQKIFIKGLITDSNFVPYLQQSIKILQPINSHLIFCEDDKYPISEGFQCFNVLTDIFEESSTLKEDEKKYLVKVTDARARFIYGDAHGFGNLLDHRYLGD